MDGEMTTSTQTTETAATTSAGTSTGAAGQAAGAETGNREKASAFKEFLDGLFGDKHWPVRARRGRRSYTGTMPTLPLGRIRSREISGA